MSDETIYDTAEGCIIRGVEVPVISDNQEAIALLDRLAAEAERSEEPGGLWPSVFHNRGWGEPDDMLEISIITGLTGRNTQAMITSDVYKYLIREGLLAENSLSTMKARRLHNYEGGPDD